MATVEYIRYLPVRAEVVDGCIRWFRLDDRPAVGRLPQICWADGTTWAEANLWARNQATDSRKHIKTVLSAMASLLAYAKWLEDQELSWWHFPALESERCLNRFRGALIAARNEGQLAPSTASSRMAAVIRFYRWLDSNRIISADWPMWNERQIGIRLTDAFGFNHSLNVRSTDLAIPIRKTAGSLALEDGVLPVSIEKMRQILEVAQREASEELYLMLRIGFETGLRIGSICDLKVRTIFNAPLDPVIGWHRLAVGPGATPPVETKFGVTGHVPMPCSLRDELYTYATSTRRIKRQALAAPEDRDKLFLNRYGSPYSSPEGKAINVAMGRLRKAFRNAGINGLSDFYFHRTRATFATELMRAALKAMPVSDALPFVRDACLHKDESTTLKYVKFIQKTKAMAEAANAFSEAFMGLARRSSACA